MSDKVLAESCSLSTPGGGGGVSGGGDKSVISSVVRGGRGGDDDGDDCLLASHGCCRLSLAVIRFSGSLTSNCETKFSASSEMSLNASSSKSYLATVTLPIVSTSVSPINGDKPDNLQVYQFEDKKRGHRSFVSATTYRT